MIPRAQTRSPVVARELLEQELQCFHQIMDHTQDILDESDAFSMEAILNLLDKRDLWIEEIRRLETKLQQQTPWTSSRNNQKLRAEINAMAKSLVVTDARLLDILQMKKNGMIKELGKLAENRSEVERTMRRNQMPRLIDTRRA